MARLEISTTSYQFAHGQAPRGRGYWAFEFYKANAEGRLRPVVVHPDEPAPLNCVWFAKCGTYSDAKRQARDKARELGATFAKVCS